MNTKVKGQLHKFDVDSLQTGHYHPLMDQILCLCMSPVLFTAFGLDLGLFRQPAGRGFKPHFEFTAVEIPPLVSTLLISRTLVALAAFNQPNVGLYSAFPHCYKGLKVKRGEMSNKTGEIGIKPRRAL